VTLGARGPAGPRGKQGAQGKPGANGVTHGYVAVKSDAIELVSSDLSAIVQVSLPAGSYIVSAKTVASSANGGATGVGCVLRDSSTEQIDAADAAIAAAGSETLALAGAVTSTSAVTVTLDCGGTGVNVADSVLTAIQVDKLTTTGS
jgi:hypothetical protein